MLIASRQHHSLDFGLSPKRTGPLMTYCGIQGLYQWIKDVLSRFMSDCAQKQTEDISRRLS